LSTLFLKRALPGEGWSHYFSSPFGKLRHGSLVKVREAVLDPGLESRSAVEHCYMKSGLHDLHQLPVGFWIDFEGLDGRVYSYGWELCTCTEQNAVRLSSWRAGLGLVPPLSREAICGSVASPAFGSYFFLQHGLKPGVCSVSLDTRYSTLHFFPSFIDVDLRWSSH